MKIKSTRRPIKQAHKEEQSRSLDPHGTFHKSRQTDRHTDRQTDTMTDPDRQPFYLLVDISNILPLIPGVVTLNINKKMESLHLQT